MNQVVREHATHASHLDLSQYRPVAVAEVIATVKKESDRLWRINATEPLQKYPERLSDCLIRGAEQYPDRILLATRGADGDWIKLTYCEVFRQARHIGQALLNAGLSAERPLMILSANDAPHLLLAMGAMLAGIAYCPVSPAYSIVATDLGKLAQLVQHVTPGMVYASSGSLFSKAILSAVPEDVVIVLEQGSVAGRETCHFETLLTTPIDSIDRVSATVTADTIAKFMFTSGSTNSPKAVITTHRMLCSNQQMLLQTFPFFGEQDPVLMDWLPWNHTFGGSHNFGIALYNGGSYYVDDGKPTTQDFHKTLRNLREISPIVFFNVPKGWELLTEALEKDSALCKRFYSRMRLFFFAGAALSQAAWNRLDRVTAQHCGERIRMMAGLGMTETSPSCTFTTGPVMMAGYVGLPAPGCEVKLVLLGDKFEVRFKGPHVMPGYWRAAQNTADAFDEEGFYRTGDAVRFVDPAAPEIGLMFDGRIAEDFKLSSGTFVSVGPLRAKVISEGAPYIQDVVVTGINRDTIGLFIFPRLDNCILLAGLTADAHASEVFSSPAVRAYFHHLLKRLNENATGSASRIARLMLMEEAPSLNKSEITDKGSINQRAVLINRADLVDQMYDSDDAPCILAS
ncbi:feruloyl-CoA synthase [Undibacterium sp. GrIS 1.2]|uniref:feruloyl-CoA synthase n=1 Tax=Undibacterium sp. GrIS 1.2 TaxID=3143933 RepID=UPI00339B97FF